MEISAKMIKELKEITGAGIVDCKKALKDTDGNIEEATKILRQKGLKKAAKKEGRDTNEGKVAYRVEDGKGVLVKVNCETDFVAKTDDFNQFVNSVLESVFEKEYPFSKELPEELEQMRKEAVGKLGENMNVSDWKVMKTENKIYPYVHLNKVATLMEYTGDADDEVIKNLAMQITAMDPEAVKPEGLPEDTVKELTEQYKKEAEATGKPEKVIEKIVEGKLRKYYEENVLSEQDFIMDEDKKVKDVLKGIDIISFQRVSL